MKKVTILAMQNTMSSAVTGPLEVFAQTGVMWNHFNGKPMAPRFEVGVVTTHGRPFKCLSGVRIVPDGSIHDIDRTDLVVISSILDIEKTMRVQPEAVDWIRRRYRQGAHVASVCSGAFVLAETGLLDGKTATTHWAFADRFRRRYPRIRLKTERMVTDEGDLFCSGGANAGVDLALYLVAKYCGREVALQSAKAMIAEFGRTTQAPYAIFPYRKDHGDDQVLAVQDWIETHCDQNFNYEDLARRSGMSRRTMERRFKSATGETPLTYQQGLRVEAAKRLLEQGPRSFDEITYAVGYEDASTFRKIFSKQTGLVPSEYRQKFQRI
jgi:transcriptional regulator GlxA family with amidase domain